MRQSTASRSQSNSQSAILQTLQNKKKEFEAIEALEQRGTNLISALEEMAADLSTTADATTAIGRAMEHWSEMFYILGLTLQVQNSAYNDDSQVHVSPMNRLVRLPIEELQSQPDERKENAS